MTGPDVCRAVLADDEPRLLAALRDLLESTGRIEVVASVGTADEAEAACREHDADTVVLDVHMPGDGLWAARRITRLLPSIRVVMLTGDDLPAVRAAAAAAGVDAFVSKTDHGDVVAAVLGDEAPDPEVGLPRPTA